MSNTLPTALPRSVMDQLLDQRIVWLNGAVDDESANNVAVKLMLLSAKDQTSDIIFCINSPGGSVTAGSMLTDVINLIPNDVVTIAFGMAASMGQFLLTQGAPGKRFATPLLRVLMHQPSGGFGGQADDIEGQADLIDDMKHRLATYTANRTGQTLETVLADGERDKWYVAEEALDYGFVDHLISGDLNSVWAITKEVDEMKVNDPEKYKELYIKTKEEN